MPRKHDVVIIGAGSAGLSAFKEARKYTDDVVIVDHGPLGTTCARVGCMPSKVMIQAADYFYERKYLVERGISGADELKIHIPATMQYVRKLRDFYTSGVLKYMEKLGNHYVDGTAGFIEPNIISVNGEHLEAKSIIIATGTDAIIPDPWQQFRNQVLTSDTIFEQQDFAHEIAVIGAGVIGLELGQALSRMGIDVHVFHSSQTIGTLTDPVVNEVAVKVLREEFPICLDCKANVEKNADGKLAVTAGSKSLQVEQILAALGRRPNFEELNLDAIGVGLNDLGLPDYDCATMQLKDLPIFLAGDVNKTRPLLHEAADEGRIAGFNATHDKKQRFKRRTPLTIIFTQPNIAIAGCSFKSLQDRDIKIGEVSFEDQGRARLMSKNKGMLRVYADAKDAKLLGAEMIAPGGEHIAHQLAWAIQQNMTVFDVLRMPYYHPTLQEGMRTALRDLAGKFEQLKTDVSELSLCDSESLVS